MVFPAERMVDPGVSQDEAQRERPPYVPCNQGSSGQFGPRGLGPHVLEESNFDEVPINSCVELTSLPCVWR